MKALALLAPLAILCASCTTTTTYWVPVYTMQTSETQERSGFDPATRTITNPEEGATFACYEGEQKQAVVYSDRCSLSLARKIVVQDAGFNSSASTAEAISNLVLTKSFLTGGTDDTGVKLPNDPEGALKSAGIDYRGGFQSGLAPLLVGFLVWSIGLSLGAPTGYAINPARDLGPRLAHALLPIAGKGDSDWGYSWVPIVGPVIGGLLGAVAYVRVFGA